MQLGSRATEMTSLLNLLILHTNICAEKKLKKIITQKLIELNYILAY